MVEEEQQRRKTRVAAATTVKNNILSLRLNVSFTKKWYVCIYTRNVDPDQTRETNTLWKHCDTTLSYFIPGLGPRFCQQRSPRPRWMVHPQLCLGTGHLETAPTAHMGKALLQTQSHTAHARAT